MRKNLHWRFFFTEINKGPFESPSSTSHCHKKQKPRQSRRNQRGSLLRVSGVKYMTADAIDRNVPGVYSELPDRRVPLIVIFEWNLGLVCVSAVAIQMRDDIGPHRVIDGDGHQAEDVNQVAVFDFSAGDELTELLAEPVEFTDQLVCCRSANHGTGPFVGAKRCSVGASR
jgi:hypothetical protein